MEKGKRIKKTIPYGDAGSIVVYEDDSMEGFDDVSLKLAGQETSEDEEKAILKKYMQMMKERKDRK